MPDRQRSTPVKHTQLAVPESPGHHAPRNPWKYLPLVAIALLGAYEYSPGLFAVLAIFGGLAFALRQRIERLGGGAMPVAPSAGGFIGGDGGCFPGARPTTKPGSATPVVVDGGSFEHLRRYLDALYDRDDTLTLNGAARRLLPAKRLPTE